MVRLWLFVVNARIVVVAVGKWVYKSKSIDDRVNGSWYMVDSGCHHGLRRIDIRLHYGDHCSYYDDDDDDGCSVVLKTYDEYDQIVNIHECT